MQRFNWNEDLLHQSFLAGKQDFLSLSTRALRRRPRKKRMTSRIIIDAAAWIVGSFQVHKRGIFARDLLTVATLLSLQ